MSIDGAMVSTEVSRVIVPVSEGGGGEDATQRSRHSAGINLLTKESVEHVVLIRTDDYRAKKRTKLMLAIQRGCMRYY